MNGPIFDVGRQMNGRNFLTPMYIAHILRMKEYMDAKDSM